ncbi:MAG: DUF4293 domain-containing protein [Rikenellaceae bacterium]
MIQRIQTIYLLAAISLMATFILSPLATFITTDNIYALSVMGLKDADGTMVYSMPYLIIISALTAILPLINIFLFKKRMLQIRLCVVQIVLLLGTLVIGGVYYYLSNRYFGGEGTVEASIRIVCALPLAAVFFDYLALKAILKDELLIKSLDRIR